MAAIFAFSVLGRVMVNRRSHSVCTVSSRERALALGALLPSTDGGGLTMGTICLSIMSSRGGVGVGAASKFSAASSGAVHECGFAGGGLE